MKNLIVGAVFALGLVAGIEAAPTDAVTQADLQALIKRLVALEAENKLQAAKIKELEAAGKATAVKVESVAAKPAAALAMDAETTTNESGRIFTTGNGKKYYLADVSARIFEPLSESGLQVTPYGYLVFEGVYSDRPLDCDWSADFVKPMGRGNYTTLSMQDSIMGLQFMTPEAYNGWKFSGKAEFDLAGGDQNSYDFHWRHLYVDAAHESGWSILFGQTWHLWKMVSPSEIDGAWMENAGHPYRRSPQLRITKRWDWEDSSLETRFGIVKGGPGMGGDRDGDSVQDNTASAWALLQAAAIYDHDAPWQDPQDELQDSRWLLGVAGMYGRDRSQRFNGFDAGGDPKFGGAEDDYDSMMGMFAASLPVWRFTLKGQIFAGENLGGVQAGCAQRVVYHNYLNDYVRGNGVRTIGGFIDLGYRLTDKWSFAIGWGCDNPFNDDIEGGIAPNGVYGIKYNDRAYFDVFYQITSNFKLGLEYARMMTSFTDGNAYADEGGDYAADRVQFSAFYDF